jgi:signal transduction histidine kinase
LQAERLAAIGQMIAVLTHESGNVLARSQVLLANLAEEVQDRPGAVDLIDHLKKAHGDLRHLYDEVRNYAAPIKLEFMPWDVGAIWRQAWSKVIAAHGANKIATLNEKIDGIHLVCEADNFRLDQVFRNLFDNAIAAGPEPVKVEVACTDAVLNGRPVLRIAVRDNGPGLTPAEGAKVFAPFYTTKKKGTGLGMAIVKRIVEAHSGEITVGDRAQGAEFIVTLPRNRSTETEPHKSIRC